MKKLILGALLCVFGATAQAIETTTPNWTNADCDVDNANFNTCELSFPAVYADTLISINNAGDFIYHDGDGSRIFTLDARVDGSWVPLWTDVPPPASGNLLISENVLTPIAFTGGLVNGIRFQAIPGSNQSFHNAEALMSFTLDGQVSPVPTLSEYSLMLLIMMLAGIGIYSQRRKLRDIS